MQLEISCEYPRNLSKMYALGTELKVCAGIKNSNIYLR
jgi:hypothetical protein